MKSKSSITIALLILFTAGSLIPSGQAAHDGSLVIQVVNDVFDVVAMEDIQFEPGCEGGAYEILPSGDGFRFYEVTEGAGQVEQVPNQNGGFDSTGCLTARYPIDIPLGLDHFHVRFNSSRTITEFEAINSGIDAEQSLLLQSKSGVELARRNYFAASDGTKESLFIDPVKFELAGNQSVDVAWFFEDYGFGASQDVPNALSGIGYEATVVMPIIEYSYLPPANSSSVDVETRAGTQLVSRSTVVSTLDEASLENFDRINVRVHTKGTPNLVSVTMPDGTVITDTATRSDNGPDGYDSDQILVEHFSQVESWFTVPYGLVAQYGAGDYVFVIEESQGLTVTRALVPFAIGIAVLPFIASAFAIATTTKFRREAFGGFQRAATWLIVAIAALLAYYVSVMISAIITGTIDRMVIRPFDAGAWLLYMQVGLAAAGFIVVFIVGRELYRITVPRKPE